MVKQSSNKPGNSTDQQKKDRDKRKMQRKDVKPRPDEHLEQIPFRLREIMKSKEKMKMGSKKLKKMRTTPFNAQTETSDDIPVPHFRRGKQESESAYLKRMSRETEHVLFLTNNQSERQPELHLEETETKSNKQKSEKKKLFDKGRLERLHKKKLSQKEEKAEKEMFKDEVQFGEVAMQPPALTAKPRKAPGKSQGASKDLLLNSLLGQTASTVKPSMARQRMMEEERERVVQAYRQLKKQKQEQQEKQKSMKKKGFK
ncbi:coiled-coil domain-containing protein 137 [Astyanax mexicanus]|uniref:Coiled-coil domain containing 137 n=2 Tax=Astyanax mexicanus TaxID=7994 RepID=W5LNI8_ASTMX|nr:coiled-coil domain-containing protein 137 [Astyanax mexicanus]